MSRFFLGVRIFLWCQDFSCVVPNMFACRDFDLMPRFLAYARVSSRWHPFCVPRGYVCGVCADLLSGFVRGYVEMFCGCGGLDVTDPVCFSKGGGGLVT